MANVLFLFLSSSPELEAPSCLFHCYSSALFSFLWDSTGLYSLIYFMDSDRIHLLEAQIRLCHFLTSRRLMTRTACFLLSKPSGLELAGDPQRRTPVHPRVSTCPSLASSVCGFSHYSLPVHGISGRKCLPIPSPSLFYPFLSRFDMAKARPPKLPVQLEII